MVDPILDLTPENVIEPKEKEVSKLLTKSKYFSNLLNTTINVLRTSKHDRINTF